MEAVCRAISQVTNTSAKLDRYEIRGVTSGTEAMGEVTVQLEEADRKVVGRRASTDVIEASAKAYIDGLNRLASLTAGRAWLAQTVSQESSSGLRAAEPPLRQQPS